MDALSRVQDDPLLNKLVFSHAVTILEKYLCDLFIHNLSSDPEMLRRLANENMFREQRVGVVFALNNCISDWMIKAMKRLVWHRLNDIQILYKNVLLITFDLDRSILDAINKRHHLVHRNGFDWEGNAVSVVQRDLDVLFSDIDEFVSRIDRQYPN